MFWNYHEWQNAFIIQLIAIIVTIVFGKKNHIRDTDLFLIISLFSPVALLLISAGARGAIFLSDFAAVYLLFRRGNAIIKHRAILLVFLLYILWPIISTLISNVYDLISGTNVSYDTKVLLIQSVRYFLYFILFAKLISRSYYDVEYLIGLYRTASVMIFFIFSAILLGYLNLIKVDAWNELIKFEGEHSIGKGGMFLYRGGVGTLGVISLPIVYLALIQGRRLHKYFLGLLILIIFLTVLYSGSRQGIIFFSLSFILSVILFKQYKHTLPTIIVGIIIVILLLPQFNVIRENSEWVKKRYDVFMNENYGIKDEIIRRNYGIIEANRLKKNHLFKISGVGLGGNIHHTESDYYDSYSYFGIIGIFFYSLFIFYSALRIYKNRKMTESMVEKQILTVSFIIAITMPLFGFQQWYLMTYSSVNSTNCYLILFLLSVGISSYIPIDLDT